MNFNFNIPPSDRSLPESFQGKKPIHVAHAVISENPAESGWKTLCTDGSYVVLKPTDFVKTPEVTA